MSLITSKLVWLYFDIAKIGGCNGIRTHIGDFTRPLTADSLPIRFHAPIEMAGVDGIAPPLRESESPVPLLYETPNSSAQF